MARQRRTGNNSGRNSGNSGLSVTALKRLGFNPANSNRRGGGSFTTNRRSNNNTAGFTGFNAAGFGLKSNTSNVAAPGRRGAAGGTQASGRGRSSGNNTTGFNAAGAATTTGRSSGG